MRWPRCVGFPDRSRLVVASAIGLLAGAWLVGCGSRSALEEADGGATGTYPGGRAAANGGTAFSAGGRVPTGGRFGVSGSSSVGGRGGVSGGGGLDNAGRGARESGGRGGSGGFGGTGALGATSGNDSGGAGGDGNHGPCPGGAGGCSEILPACGGREDGARYCDNAILWECLDGGTATRSLQTCPLGCLQTPTTASCIEGCGDGIRQSALGETCDDGNTQDGDACPADCRWKVVAIAAGDTHTCAIAENGVIKCWGDNTSCQLGVGRSGNLGDQPSEMGEELPRVELGSGARPTALALGMVSSCVLREDGSVKCWGESPNGETGLGSIETRGCAANEMGDALPALDLGTGFLARGLIAGYRHACALSADERVKCWGMNLGGQLGIPDGTRSSWGDAPDRVGDNLPFVALATGDRVKAIGGGHASSCAILFDGTAKCWGYNVSGELGIGLKGLDGVFIGDQPGELGAALPAIPLGTGRVPVAMHGGTERMCALLENGQVLCWGEYVGDDPGEVGDSLPPIPLGAGRTARSIAAGRYHTCAVLDDATLKCWGWGGGRLGQGDVQDRRDPVLIANLPPIDLGGAGVTMVAAGWWHTCALLAGGTVKCWGNNEYGQLGLGDMAARGDEPGEMGAALPAVDLAF